MKRAFALGMALLLGCMLGLTALPAMGEGEGTSPASYQPLQFGDQGEEVSRIQQRLTDLGYYSGKISGNFLDGTRAAVTRFQKDYGLEQTGIADGQTEALLMSAEYRSLATGSDGEDVKRLQEHLADLGYYKAKLTGKYLEVTTASVKVFQERNGLTPTGQADVSTQQLLFSGKAASKDDPITTLPPDPDMDVGDINDVVMAPDGADGQMELKDIDYSKKLSRGAKGQSVKQVQQKLTDLGYYDGPISGNYMDKTIDGVKRFQLNNGLQADGITGETTWNLLFNDVQVLDAAATPRPTPVPTPVPYAVTVDVRNQVVLVNGRDEAGEFTVPVKRMICSTGMKATPSTVGDWVLDGRKARWCYFPAWGSHAQYWTRINPYIAFHSVIYRAVDYMALSVKSYNMLGSRASHGCIRLLVSDAKWIYDNVGEGVVVTIREDLPEDQELTKALQPPALNREYMRPVNTPQPTAEPAYSATAQPPQPFRILKKGKSGEDVYWMQRKLQDLGYYTGTATGSFYNGTYKAVKAFQKDHGIYADGIAGERTLEALYADVLKAREPEESQAPEGSQAPEETGTPEEAPKGTSPTAAPTRTLTPSASPAPPTGA